MSVGVHYTQQDWNNRAADLRQRYLAFAQLAEEMASDIAPYDDATVATKTGFSTQDVSDLRSGINVADALRKVAEGNTTDAVGPASGTLNLMVNKFGGA